jgi:hypothetical protein
MNDATSVFQFVDDPHAFRDPAALVVRVPAKARGKEKLLDVLSRGLRLPKYFGRNWDALDECLRDLAWLGDVERVVIVHEGLPFARGGDHLPIYLDLLRDVVNERKSGANPSLEVVFPSAIREFVEID